MLALTYVLIRPILWLIDILGYSDRAWNAIMHKMKEQFLAGHDFGDYRPTKHDVLVCAFPKCGQNWTLQIAHQIAMRGRGEFDHLHDKIPWPDFARQDIMVPLSDDTARQEAPTGLRVIKTHLEWERVPYTEEARYICVLRDPKDAFVSNYHFIRDVFFGTLMPSVPVWLRLFCSDATPFIWSEHLHGYWRNRHLPNVLILTYEDMKKDMAASVKRIADFMGVELTQDEFDLVCEKSSFAYMKAAEDKFHPPAMTPWSLPGRQMIRRGVSGGSSELISSEQQRFIDDHFRADLQRLGSDCPYDEMWGDKAGVKQGETAVESAQTA